MRLQITDKKEAYRIFEEISMLKFKLLKATWHNYPYLNQLHNELQKLAENNQL